ncbi:MAG: cation:proton antiporter, partial [Nitrospinota bacterium]
MELLIFLLIVLVASRLAGELLQRAGQPSLLGELLAGVGLALLAANYPSKLLDLNNLLRHEGFKIVTDLGIFFLMFLAGLEMKPEELLRASGVGLVVAVGGAVFPMAIGLGLGFAFLPASDLWLAQTVFLGIAVSITAVAVSTKILMDLGYLETRLGRIIISAAVIDDVIAMILLAALSSLANSGEIPSLSLVSWLALKAAAFFAVAFLLGWTVFHRLEAALNRLVSDEIAFTVSIAIAMFFGVASELLGMHFIIGAFVAGLFIHAGTMGRERFERVLNRTSGIALGFLSPIFFASLGMQLDFSSLSRVPLFATTLLLAAIVGKLGGCGLIARALGFSRRESLAIGVAMNGRGAVELIVAAIALEFGLFTQPTPVPPIVEALYSSVVLMAFVTTLMTPIGLKMIL